MAEAPRREGLFGALRGSLATLLALTRVRLELLAVEVHEESARLGLLLAYATGAVFFLGFGTLFLAVLITVLLWDSNRLLALGVFSAIFLTTGVLFAVVATRYARMGSRLFAESLAELRRDSEAVKPDA